MRRLGHALDGLQNVLLTPPRLEQSWRYLVKQRLTWVDAALAADHPEPDGDPALAWLTPRQEQLRRDRVRLMARASVLAATVCEAVDIEPFQSSLQRLVTDLEHYLQRVNDLSWDAVDLDVGGSD